MPLICAGITPKWLIDTRELQNTEKLSPQNGTFVKSRNGVCFALVVDWLQKCQKIRGGVTDISQLKSGLSLSLAQTAYEREVLKEPGEQPEPAYIRGVGMSIESYGWKRTEPYHITKKGCLQTIVLACACGGYIIISLTGPAGAGSHTLGYRGTPGVRQFFDPNVGVLEFASFSDFGNWFPAYVLDNYRFLCNLFEYTKVKD